MKYVSAKNIIQNGNNKAKRKFIFKHQKKSDSA